MINIITSIWCWIKSFFIKPKPKVDTMGAYKNGEKIKGAVIAGNNTGAYINGDKVGFYTPVNYIRAIKMHNALSYTIVFADGTSETKNITYPNGETWTTNGVGQYGLIGKFCIVAIRTSNVSGYTRFGILDCLSGECVTYDSGIANGDPINNIVTYMGGYVNTARSNNFMYNPLTNTLVKRTGDTALTGSTLWVADATAGGIFAQSARGYYNASGKLNNAATQFGSVLAFIGNRTIYLDPDNNNFYQNGGQAANVAAAGMYYGQLNKWDNVPTYQQGVSAAYTSGKNKRQIGWFDNYMFVYNQTDLQIEVYSISGNTLIATITESLPALTGTQVMDMGGGKCAILGVLFGTPAQSKLIIVNTADWSVDKIVQESGLYIQYPMTVHKTSTIYRAVCRGGYMDTDGNYFDGYFPQMAEPDLYAAMVDYPHPAMP